MTQRHLVDEDIRTAVGVRLEKGTRLIKADREKLADRVVDKAAGMFRLASLYVDELVKSRRRSFMPSELEHLLNGLPTNLYPFYDQILDQVPPGRMQEVVFKALRWIMFAARSFWVENLVEACAIYPPSGELFDVETRQYLPCLDAIEYLSGLVRIQPILSEDEEMVIKPRTHIITLAHFSVSEYLQRLDTAHYQIDTHFFERYSASEYMSQACLIYLVETSEHSLSSEIHTTMIEYADRAWPSHVAAYLQSSNDTPYAQQATTAALASKIQLRRIRHIFTLAAMAQSPMRKVFGKTGQAFTIPSIPDA
ncbi:hypothetical protein J4E91_008751 [Alternaria rosae]|nr:hypothetical protein J4E91_008751 [Alternaria rosae]